MKPVSLFAGALFLSTLISAVPNANGAIIEPIDLFAPGDGAATFVDTTGLNWLDLTFTFGMSVPDVESDLTLGGLLDDSWRVAELSEIDALLTAYGFTPDSSCNNGAQHCSASGENAAAAFWVFLGVGLRDLRSIGRSERVQRSGSDGAVFGLSDPGDRRRTKYRYKIRGPIQPISTRTSHLNDRGEFGDALGSLRAGAQHVGDPV